ncbi:MAG: 2-hydroxyacyl-CoA dehydratase [Deltaproteobacteria bacterium]|jgi:benzoyl-CoA reductase/2-hydroxyglutaryl-CoA dehydratase subunit BcrC/BadD/HgdB|nr:2-hydroxyacyl-CoA dehydratase [Deltaproteobacteria bacterium]MBW2535491.1 2-hydroxyacyl-CoA dehydratase [Deltaproteobacteria bacterium]
MEDATRPLLGFSCAYTPLPLVDAAGLAPYRILPRSDTADQAGTVLHDNLCPHVKRVLDRALAGELPRLRAVVFMDSCDAMRRACDAWRRHRPDDEVVLVDLPVDASNASVAFFAQQLGELASRLGRWGGCEVTVAGLRASVARYNELAADLASLADHAAHGRLEGGRAELQRLLVRSVTEPLDEVLGALERLAVQLDGQGEAPGSPTARAGAPVFLFGNVLPDPAAFELFDDCGARVVGDDVCTGMRQLAPLAVPERDGPLDTVLGDLARAVLERPSCPRTMGRNQGRELGRRIVADARRSGARGVIAHVMKFCDPYLARLPVIQSVLREASLPLLVLEGDCTLRSLGQHRTRIEAFVEMLGEPSP